MIAKSDQRSLAEKLYLYMSRRENQRFAANQLARTFNVRIVMVLDAMETLSERGSVTTESVPPKGVTYAASSPKAERRNTLEPNDLTD